MNKLLTVALSLPLAACIVGADAPGGGDGNGNGSGSGSAGS